MLNNKQLSDQFHLQSSSRNNNYSLVLGASNILVQSKNCVDKLGNRITEANKNLIKNQSTVKCIKDTAKEIKKTIESKIQNNFNSILNEQARVNIDEQIYLQPKEKQEATKKLMQNYWQKRQETQSEARKKATNAYKQNMFPKIKTNQQSQQESINKTKKKAIISSLNVKMYQKQKQRQSMKIKKQQKILAYLYSYMVHIIDYKIQNDTPEFLLFQKLNYNKWNDIQSILAEIQSFSRKYQLKYCTLDLQKVMQLVDIKSKTQKNIRNDTNKKITIKSNSNITFTCLNSFDRTSSNLSKKIYTAHQLLGCLQNGEEISAKNQKKAGIRFYGNKGKLRAIIKIQAIWRGKIVYNKTKKIIQMIKKLIKIQRAYRLHLSHRKTKQLIRQNCLKRFEWFKEKQQKFRSTYRVNQLTKKIKYEIYICSDNQNDWQRISTEKFLQKQNCYLTRIFKPFKQDSINEKRIVFVSAYPIPVQVMNYSYKLLQLRGAKNFRNNLIFMSPQKCQKLIDKLSLVRVLYYCPSFLNRLKSIINNQYAYIIPSNPSIDYVSLCYALDVPLYSSNPQQLLYLQTNSGSKSLVQQICRKQNIQFPLPYAINIYSLAVLVNQLTQLIQIYPYIWRWVLKIDNQRNSRGIALVQLNKILPKKMIKFMKKCYYDQTNKKEIAPQIKALKKQIFDLVYDAITQGEKITIISKNIYRSQTQYLNFFFSNGGIIQAQINQYDRELQNICFCLQIEPDYQWKFISNYNKLTIKKRSLCCYFDSQLIEPPMQIEALVKQLIKKKCFGYFVFSFLKQNQPQNNLANQCKKINKFYFNGMKCYLDQYSSSSFMRQFISKQSNALYIPYIPHDNIKKISMATFFHLCRLQNISFDIQRKIGNIFMFLDGLESGCLGIMTFNDKSKTQTFIHAAQVLDFFSAKVDHSVISGPPQNSINGYLNYLRKKNLIVKSNQTKGGRKSKKIQSYLQKQYFI